MCGITAFIDPAFTHSFPLKQIEDMVAALHHRGPDMGGVYLNKGVALGHRRLSIIDIEGGKQPLFNGDNTLALIFNGMIYNYKSLRKELTDKGFAFKTQTDTEVILHGYAAYGTDIIHKLDGFFAFILYDEIKKQVFIARDRLGKKPLYYGKSPEGHLIFASELKGVLTGLPNKPAFNPQAIEDYFAYGYIPDPKTIYEGISKFPPAHYCVIEREKPVYFHRYWDLPQNGVTNITLESAAEQFKGLFRKSIEKRLASDVPIGAFLSGGADSAGVVSEWAKMEGGQSIHTFTIGFSEKNLDERPFANQIAQYYHTHHTDLEANLSDMESIASLASIYGEPFADGSALATCLVSKMTSRKGIKVALSGDGGDEIFAGYRRYPFLVFEQKIRSIFPSWFRKSLFGGLASVYPTGHALPRFLRLGSTLESLATDWIGGLFRGVVITPDHLRFPLYTEGFKQSLGDYHARSVLTATADTVSPHWSFLQKLQAVDIKTWLPGRMLVKTDRASMANGLELRSPLLDTELLEFAFRLPDHLKLQGHKGKYLLKHYLEKSLPPAFLDRPKQGFVTPLAAWMNSHLSEALDNLLHESVLKESDIINMKVLENLVEQHRNGTHDHSRILWACLMFEGFLNQV